MGVERKSIVNMPDRIGADGKWIMTWSETTSGVLTQYHTAASILWQNILKRCDPTGSYQDKNKSYAGVTNEFESFNSFAGWCQSQFGYGEFQDGKRWHLDKDLLSGAVKSYSPETCVFIPHRINSLISKAGNVRGNDLPAGLFISGVKYCAQISNCYGKNRYLGTFDDPESASAAYRKAKSDLLLEQLEKMAHSDNRVTDAIRKLAAQIISDEE